MILVGDALEILRTIEPDSIQTCITSPPYWGLRDYGVEGQIGLEKTPDEYVANIVSVFRELRRVLRKDGTLWLNLGDSYSQGGSGGSGGRSTLQGYTGPHCKQALQQAQSRPRKTPEGMRSKNLVGIPWRVAFALQADGWYLRQDIIWHKPNPMPESVRDRCTKAHEYIFLLSKRPKYYFDIDAIKEPSARGWAGPQFHTGKTGEHQLGRAQKVRLREKPVGESAVDAKNRGFGNYCGDGKDGKRQKRSVWTVTTKPFKGAHFAMFPPDLIEPCVLAGSRPGDVILDPFFGAGTTGLVAQKHGRKWIGIELNPEYAAMAEERILKWKPPKAKKEIEEEIDENQLPLLEGM